MQIKCVLDRVLVKSEARKEESGGIFLPEAIREVNLPYRVVSAGPDCQHVAAGDIVLIEKKKSLEVTLGEVKHRLISEADILAKVI